MKTYNHIWQASKLIPSRGSVIQEGLSLPNLNFFRSSPESQKFLPLKYTLLGVGFTPSRVN